MKKYYSTQRFKEWNQKNSQSRFCRHLEFRRKKRHRNRVRNHLTYDQRSSESSNGVDRNRMRTVYAPVNFDFMANTDEVSSFIETLNKYLEQRKPVFVELRQVQRVSYDALTVLLSVVVRFKAKKIRFNGSMPSSATANNALRESGFFKLLFEKFDDTDRYELATKSSINTHAKRTVDAELGERLIVSASRTVWECQKRCTGLQRVLIELMQNTNNHASPKGKKEKLWWISVKHDPAAKKVYFFFVDYGVGIFTSLDRKDSDNKFFHSYNRLRRKFQFGKNTKILEAIFKGELHQTSSDKYYRGKGLPGVYKAFEANQISNLSLITNDTIFNGQSRSYNSLKTPFQGTFYSWELSEENENKPAFN
ncbi:MAG: hypothetical protein JJU20_14850 [Opitutales bacterium]|nr:hypothetical protein [Opitutales bacterium]